MISDASLRSSIFEVLERCARDLPAPSSSVARDKTSAGNELLFTQEQVQQRAYELAALFVERTGYAATKDASERAAPAPSVSIVVPAYRSELCLEALHERVSSVCRGAGESYELILVNDCSPDNTWSVIEQLSARDASVVGINLRKNFGQDNAIMAGLNAARGQCVVIMDDDLQHDPADIPALLSKLREGYDVVYASYAKEHQALWKNAGSWFNGKVAEIVLNKPREVYLSPYKVIAGAVVAEIVRYRGPYPYVDGLLFRTTSRMTQITVQHHARYSGESSYTFFKSVAVWARLSTNFSVVPLRFATVLGAIIAVVGFVIAAIFFSLRLMHPEIGNLAVGWASLAVSVLVLGGLQLVTLGVMGEYIGRMHLNLNNRPQYIVREARGGS